MDAGKQLVIGTALIAAFWIVVFSLLCWTVGARPYDSIRYSTPQEIAP